MAYPLVDLSALQVEGGVEDLGGGEELWVEKVEQRPKLRQAATCEPETPTAGERASVWHALGGYVGESTKGVPRAGYSAAACP